MYTVRSLSNIQVTPTHLSVEVVQSAEEGQDHVQGHAFLVDCHRQTLRLMQSSGGGSDEGMHSS